MRFELDADQRDFAASLDSLLSSADTVAVARAWADGDHEPGLKLWARLAEQGVTVLATEATPVEVCIAFEALGRHAVPGPWVESAAYLPVALGREVEGVATVAVPPHVPLRAGRRRRRRGLRRRHARHRHRRCARLGRPDPAAVRGHAGEPVEPWTPRRLRLAVLATSRPSCSAPASGCWPTR